MVISKEEYDKMRDNNGAVIKIESLKKIYHEGKPAEVQALRGVDLTLNYGEFLAIMGASGSGKSTLINIIGCMDSATGGSVKLEDMDLTNAPESKLGFVRKEKIGFIFQDYYLLDNLTALENVLAPLIPYGITNADRIRAKELLEIASLSDRMNHKPNELSGGQKQRVAICRALINDPLVILGDEPTGNLDSTTGSEIMDLLTQINKDRNATIIVVSHDPRVTKYASRLIELEDGRIIKDSSL